MKQVLYKGSARNPIIGAGRLLSSGLGLRFFSLARLPRGEQNHYMGNNPAVTHVRTRYHRSACCYMAELRPESKPSSSRQPLETVKG